MASVAMCPTRIKASCVWPPTWGVTIRFGNSVSGIRLCGRGSVMSAFSASRTSSAAPPNLPFRSASTRAVSSINPPRAVFTRMAWSFIRPMTAASMMLRVEGRSGRCRLRMSDSRTSSSNGTRCRPGSDSCRRAGSVTSTVIPKPSAILATCLPMLPRPRSPIVRPFSSIPVSAILSPDQSPFRVRADADLDLPAQGKDQGEDMLGHRPAVGPGRIGDPDVPGRCRRDIDRVRSHAVARDDPELRGVVDHPGGEGAGPKEDRLDLALDVVVGNRVRTVPAENGPQCPQLRQDILMDGT